MKSFSKTFSVPLGSSSFQSQQLLQTMNQIMLRQQEIMIEKLMRQQQIENRLKKIQKQYQEQTQKKQSIIKQKLQKSEKNRQNFLEKIVKKCKDKDKFYNQKMKSVNTKRKNSLREAWRVATKFNEKILQGKNHKNRSQKQQREPKPEKDQNLNKSTISVSFPDQNIEQNKSNFLQPSAVLKYFPKSNQSNIFNKTNNKSFDRIMMQSFSVEKKVQKLPRAINNQSQRILVPTIKNIVTEQENPQTSYQLKLKKTLMRHKQHIIEQENKKIQQCGQRLQKIQLSRKKRDTLQRSRIKKSTIQNQGGYYEQQRQRSQQKLTKKINQRMKSQSQSQDRVKRASDWSEFNKQRREQILLAHIQSGNQYLSENKIRYFKQIVSKSIAYNALERKLYRQRFRHM